MTWEAFVLGVIVYQIFKMVYLGLNQHLKERREKRLLKMLQITFPDNNKITFITIDANDKRAMAKIEEEVRSHYDIKEDEDENQDRSANRGRDGSLRQGSARHRRGPSG